MHALHSIDLSKHYIDQAMLYANKVALIARFFNFSTILTVYLKGIGLRSGNTS